uniref:Integrase, catalytic region, zinc finger, CCHC-type, peptidase aspartic, catalytic n=1 Tax=Tanacetum cinerariifolium TaxID=118510 RepID=A0A6L2JGY8_TANCI|nr:hypothetical protein [Tanacetum cinerariifolium]
MTTLAKHIIVARAENHPLMLEKSLYDSWASRIRLFIKGIKHGRMMLDSVNNGPLVYPTVEENGQTRPKKYFELIEAQQIEDDCDVQAMNIILYSLPPDVYAFVNHQEGETLYEYYWRFSQLINDIHTIRMTMQQVQVNTKFLNALPSKWSKLVTDVKLAKSLYTTNYDQLYAYRSQHKRHANEVRIMRSLMYPPPQQFTPVYAAPIHHQHHHTPVNLQQHPLSPLPFISPLETPQYQAEFPQLDSCLAVPRFQHEEDQIKCINKAMAFLSAILSRFPPSNNQLRTSSNPRNQATIQDGRVTVQQLQGRQNQSYAGIRNKGIATTSKGNVAAGPSRVEAGQILDEEQLAFLADPDVQEMQYSEQTHVDNFKDNEIHSGSNIILYSQYLQESQVAVIQDTNPSAPNDLLVLSLVEQMTDHVAHLDKENQTNKMEIDTLKETLSNDVKEKESLSKALTVFKIESKEKESKIDNDQLLNQIMSQEIVHIVANFMDILDVKNSCVNNCTLKNELRKLKAKNVVNIVVSKPNATLASGMFKLDIEPISPRLKNNRDAHEVYIENTIEYTDTLHGFVKCARRQYASETLLESACMFTKHVQELLVYASQTCPNSPQPSEKLVAVTLINKDKRVRFAEPVTSLGNIPKQSDSLKTKDSNKPLLTSTGVDLLLVLADQSLHEIQRIIGSRNHHVAIKRIK